MDSTIKEVIRLYNEMSEVKAIGLKGIVNKGIKLQHRFTNGFGFSALTDGKDNYVLIEKLGLFKII